MHATGETKHHLHETTSKRWPTSWLLQVETNFTSMKSRHGKQLALGLFALEGQNDESHGEEAKDLSDEG